MYKMFIKGKKDKAPFPQFFEINIEIKTVSQPINPNGLCLYCWIFANTSNLLGEETWVNETNIFLERTFIILLLFTELDL